jgi:hypothetical protein
MNTCHSEEQRDEESAPVIVAKPTGTDSSLRSE